MLLVCNLLLCAAHAQVMHSVPEAALLCTACVVWHPLVQESEHASTCVLNGLLCLCRWGIASLGDEMAEPGQLCRLLMSNKVRMDTELRQPCHWCGWVT